MKLSSRLRPRVMGQSLTRVEGADKVTGRALYAYEHPVAEPVYLHPVLSTLARGRVTGIDASAAEALEGVRLVLTPANAERLADTEDQEFAVLQSDEVAFHGQFVAAVVADTPEIAREAAGLVRVDYERLPHDVVLTTDHQGLYRPVNDTEEGGPASDTGQGDVEAALNGAEVVVDQTYVTPTEHNNPMEPHTTTALWEAEWERLTLYDSTQGVHVVRASVATVFGLEPERVRVVAPHVGGGFGSKGEAHAHNVLAAMAARALPGRPVKFALTRQQMFCLVGYRTPTIQRVRLGADRQGRLSAVVHESVEQTSTIKEFTENSAMCSRWMYAAPNRRTSHRVTALDVPVNFWMRAPGEAPGMYAAEAAMDELALACGIDPIELRAHNEPETDPQSGNPWSGRRLIRCLREGAELFGWHGRDPRPGSRREGEWLVGTGVAAASYPHMFNPGSVARVRYGEDGRYEVSIGAVDIGTGAWTALTQIAADALGCAATDVRLGIGDTNMPAASVAGGSSGTSSWGTAIVSAARAFRDEHGASPAPGATTSASGADDTVDEDYAVYSFGAHFAEVRVNADTGEVRVPRMLGMFSVGRVVNPRTVRSQFLGGMVMGMSMALHEESYRDPRHGHVANGDFAEYHIPTNADVGDWRAEWLEEEDPRATPMGSRGVGEIGIVGSSAAVANAVHHATGVRVRELPITADKLLR